MENKALRYSKHFAHKPTLKCTIYDKGFELAAVPAVQALIQNI